MTHVSLPSYPFDDGDSHVPVDIDGSYQGLANIFEIEQAISIFSLSVGIKNTENVEPYAVITHLMTNCSQQFDTMAFKCPFGELKSLDLVPHKVLGQNWMVIGMHMRYMHTIWLVIEICLPKSCCRVPFSCQDPSLFPGDTLASCPCQISRLHLVVLESKAGCGQSSLHRESEDFHMRQ